MEEQNSHINYFNLLSSNKPTPNLFSIYIGNQIRAARKERQLTQTQLAKILNRNQVTISELETGKIFPSFSLVLLLCFNLVKPISYFVPPDLHRPFITQAYSQEEEEILQIMHHIDSAKLRQLAVSLVKDIQRFDQVQRDENENPEKYYD